MTEDLAWSLIGAMVGMVLSPVAYIAFDWLGEKYDVWKYNRACRMLKVKK